MAGNLAYDKGLPVTLQFVLTDTPANATTALTLPNGGAGWEVPDGFKFHPVSLHASSDSDLTAGTITLKARKSGVALTNGPSAVLSDTVQANNGTARVGADPIVAGEIVGVQATASAALSPATCGLDAVLIGIVLPA